MSSSVQAYNSYKNSMVETASPGKLLLMLYDACLRHLELAEKAVERGEKEKMHNHLVKAQEIVMELMSSLDMQYDISKSLYSLYDYMYGRLVEANVKKTAEPVQEVAGFMAELRSTWDEAIKRAANVRHPGSPDNLDVKG